MSLDCRPDETWVDAARRQEADDAAERHAEWLVQQECESVAAVEAHWTGAFRGSARHYAASQTWGEYDGRPIRQHAEAVVDGLVVDAEPSMPLGDRS